MCACAWAARQSHCSQGHSPGLCIFGVDRHIACSCLHCRQCAVDVAGRGSVHGVRVRHYAVYIKLNHTLPTAGRAQEHFQLQYIPSMQVHKIRTFNGTETMIDLNDFNHTPQLFASVAAFVAERDKYLSGLVEELQYATDAITGKKLNVEEQLVKINMDPTGMSGVVREGWSDVDQVLTLAPKLAEPSPNRHRGIHNVQPVLMSAKAGTGKSWCVHQLAHKLAKVTLEESNSPRESPLPPPSPPALPCTLGEGLPIVIPVQKLARILRRQRNTIKSEFRNKIPTKMLQQLEELRQTKGIGNADKKLGAEGKVLLAASRKVRQDADSTNLIAEYIKTEYVTSLLPHPLR